jgi:uncharacterized short protein YbdD (DUF466 family)
MAHTRKVLRGIIEYLRDLFGETAYARYCDYVLKHGGCPLTPQEFFLWRHEEKYSRPGRCC